MLNKVYGSLLTVCLMLLAGSVSATPRVVVSIPSLHSLVAQLMQGAEQPLLILKQDMADGGDMDVFQKTQLIAADMVIWVGPGLETPMARTLAELPILNNKLITLSNYVPLLSRDDYQGPLESRQQSHDLRFWTDPRLAIMAVRMITPRLVRLDPEHQELYLDNEIALIGKLKSLEQDITARFKPFAAQPVMLSGVEPYFAHRFMPAMASLSRRSRAGLYKVSGRSLPGCTGQRGTAGVRDYFQHMQHMAQAVYSCIEHLPHQTKVAAQARAGKQHI